MDTGDEPSTGRAAAADPAAARPGKDDLAGGAAPGPGASLADGSERPPGEGALDAFVSGAAYAALGLLGGVAGVIGAYSQGWSSGPVPVAAIVLAVLVLVMVRLAGWGMGSKLGAAIPGTVWAAVTFLLSLRQPEGDLVVPGTTAGYIYIVGGLIATVIGVSMVPARSPSGSWLTAGAPRDARRP